MRIQGWALVAATAVLASCGGAPPAPPALAYRVPSEPVASYSVTDTGRISIEALGQSMGIDVGAAAAYRVSFARADDGVQVSITVTDLAATITVPMAGPVTIDESSVTGDLVFTLDRRGDVSVVSTPEIDEPAGQLVPPQQIAHSFFPALPGVAVAVGDRWTDTIQYESEAGGGETSILEYTVVGDTVVAGTSLLNIAFGGTAETTQALSMQGTEISQSTRLEIEGHVLWDLQRGIMFERVSSASGRGTVRAALLPAELPTRFAMRSRARLDTR
jgi:hypothetical protein